MNRLITLVLLSIVSILLTSPTFLPSQNMYQNEAYGQGYNVVEITDSEEATEEEEEAMEDADDDD